MKGQKITEAEKIRLVNMLTQKYSIDELNEITGLLRKDNCKVNINIFKTAVSIGMINDYGRHQFNRGCTGSTLLPFEQWSEQQHKNDKS